MLNYINICVYLAEMVPLKRAGRGVCGVLVLGVCGKVCGAIGMKRKGTPTHGTKLINEVVHDPTIVVRGSFGPHREGGKGWVI